MSYSGTVHCSYCGKRGHNRLGCPERRKAALKDPDSYVGRSWAREQESRRKSIASRVCSYCKSPGHNRRGCAALKEDKRLVEQRQSEFLGEFAAAATAAGFGPGALIKVHEGRTSDHHGGFLQGYLALVQSVEWEHLDFLLSDTDSSRGWRERDRPVAKLRVVSAFGYDQEKERYWSEPPKFNDTKHLSASKASVILKEVLHNALLNPESMSSPPASMASPVRVKLGAPSGLPPMTQSLIDRFNFDPDKRADEWQKVRADLKGQEWSRVRPEEHESAKTNS